MGSSLSIQSNELAGLLATKEEYIFLHCIMMLVFAGLICGDHLTPEKTEVTSTDGESVTLSCSYDTSSNDVWLHWYRHYLNQAPQFILYKGARYRSGSDHIPDTRYESKTSRTTTELTISKVTLSDTALYYCALDYTVIQSLDKAVQKHFHHRSFDP